MPENKRQHFVPLMYLRNFTNNNDKTLIGIYNIKNEDYIEAGPVKTQAYEDYFYGKDGKYEKYITNIETNASDVIREIIENNKLPVCNSKEHIYLIKFISTLISRTEYEVEALEEANEKLLDIMAKNEVERQKLLEEFEAGKKLSGMTGRGAMSLYMGIVGGILLGDLNIKLLISKNERRLITSDNPVIKYNMYYEDKIRIGSNVGLSVLGLQIFLPLCKTKCLILYDGFVYKIGAKDNDVVMIDNGDVDNLNKLQFLNSNYSIYFDKNETKSDYLSEISKNLKEKRIKQKTEVVMHKIDKVNRANIFRTSRIDIKNGLKISYGFISDITKYIKLSEDIVYIRSKELERRSREIQNRENETEKYMKIMDILDLIEQIKKRHNFKERA